MRNKLLIIFFGLSATLIILGLILQSIKLNKELVEKTDILEKLEVENIKLKQENDALWDTYYANVSDYEGVYEYYE